MIHEHACGCQIEYDGDTFMNHAFYRMCSQARSNFREHLVTLEVDFELDSITDDSSHPIQNSPLPRPGDLDRINDQDLAALDRFHEEFGDHGWNHMDIDFDPGDSDLDFDTCDP